MNHEIELARSMYKHILNKNIDKVTNILKGWGLNPNVLIPGKGMTVLHLAAGVEPAEYSEEVTQLILDHGGDPNQRSEDGMTSLHVAAAWGHTGVVELLLAGGADQFLEDCDRKTPLDYAEENDHTHVAQRLIGSHDTVGDTDTPVKFTLKLDKVIVNNKWIGGEYCLEKPTEASLDIDSSFRKSEFVNEWFEKNKEIGLKHRPTVTMLQTEQCIRNSKLSNGDKSKSYSNHSVNKCKDVFEVSKVSSYKSCVEEKLEDCDAKFNDTHFIVDVKDNNDLESSQSDSYASGLETFGFTNIEENEPYSVFYKIDDNISKCNRFEVLTNDEQNEHNSKVSKTCDGANVSDQLKVLTNTKEYALYNDSSEIDDDLSIKDDKIIKKDDEISKNVAKRKTFVNYVFPVSPVLSPHQNYHSKTTLRGKRNELNKIICIDNSLEVSSDSSTSSSDVSKATNERKSDADVKLNGALKDSCFFEESSIREMQSSDEHIDELKFIDHHADETRVLLDAARNFRKSIPRIGLVNETMTSVVAEYKYEDDEAGVALIEKRILVTPCPVISDVSDKAADSSSALSSVSSLPVALDYDTDALRKELTQHGVSAGPITSSTKQVYLKRLYRLKKTPIIVTIDGKSNDKCKSYSVELEKTFRDTNWHNDLAVYISLERKIVEQFEEPDPKKKWREGIVKSSFTYLLLDPRITENLPVQTGAITNPESWRKFVDSIFYVGKGKRSRPYSHLYQAVTLYKAGQMNSNDKKVQHILDIWKANLGVVCLHIFQNVIPVEAYTREAAMIEVLGLKNLKNAKVGNYYGVVSTWPLKQKKHLGVYLLYRAMLIFLNEGERQLRPADIG